MRQRWGRFLLASCALLLCFALNHSLAPHATALAEDYLIALAGACLLVCAAGLALGLRRRRLLTVLLISTLLYSGTYALSIRHEGFSSGDFGHCQEFIEAAEDTHLLPQSQAQPELPACFCQTKFAGTFRAHYQIVTAYGVTGREGEDKLLEAWRLVIENYHAGPVIALFFKQENWMTQHDEKTGTRGPEQLVRTAILR